MADSPVLYAWSDVRYADKDGNAKVLKRGEVVTPEKLNMSKEEFDNLADGTPAAAFKPQKFPNLPDGYQDSPVNFLREQASRAEEAA